MGRTARSAGLGEFNAVGTIAAVVRMPGHGGVAATGAKKPFSVGPCVHEFEVAVLDAIGATDRMVAVALNSSGFADEGKTFLVHREAGIVGRSSLGRESFGADRAAGYLVIHEYQDTG
jgi:hypothetical protein